MRRSVIILAALTAFSMGQIASAQYGCPQPGCGGECRCASRQAPGSIPHDELPQFILVTFDDGINVFSESLVQPVIGGLRNPDSSVALVTYFVTKVNTTPAVARERYLEGHELANHTSTHTTGAETTIDEWRRELSTTNQFLVNQVGIPSDQIAGFRAPYLATGEAMWRALQEYRFTYDASIPETFTVPRLVSTAPDSFVWPHTLDHGAGLSCLSNHCPEGALPGVWTIPLWMWYDSAGAAYGAMDPAVGTDSTFGALLEYNFAQRYNGNRCPLGLFLHAGQLGLPGRREVLRAFLEEKLSRPDVWMITMRGLVEWMRDPVPVSGLAAWFRQGRHRGVGRVAGSPPAVPELMSPAGDSTFADAAVPLRWDVVLTASGYQVQVSAVADMSVNLLDTLVMQGSEIEVGGLPASTPMYWRVRAVNTAGPGGWSEARRFVTAGRTATGVGDGGIVVGGFVLDQSYPNPFNPSTTISFTLGAGGRARLRVFNVLGMEVATLVDADLPRGSHRVVWDGAGYASGVYLYQLQAGEFGAMRRMVLLK